MIIHYTHILYGSASEIGDQELLEEIKPGSLRHFNGQVGLLVIKVFSFLRTRPAA